MRAIARLVAAPLFVAVTACGGAGGAVFDPVRSDPLQPDALHPARIEGIGFESGGARLNAVVYEAAGAGPHPTTLLLHGFPGNERNTDLAQAIRRAGWNVVLFHYRGSWGSGGGFSFANVLEDVAAVVAQVRAPAFAGAHRVDPSRIALVGHSMGGFAALVSGAELEDVGCVGSIAGANFGLLHEALADPEQAEAMARQLDAWGRGPIRGVSGALLVAEVRSSRERFDTLRHAEALARKPLLLVAGSRDAVTPPAIHHEPLAAALRAQGAARIRARVLDSDHDFSDRRIALAGEVVDFLIEECSARS